MKEENIDYKKLPHPLFDKVLEKFDSLIDLYEDTESTTQKKERILEDLHHFL